MIASKIKLLQNLIEIPSPSGFEREIAEYIKKELIKYVSRNKIKIDFQNNVIVSLEGKDTTKTILIDAHLDEVGYIINNISGNGYISLSQIGGGDTSILSARHLTILTEKGKINAVVNRKHNHLVEDEDEETIDTITKAQVDIGVRKGKAVKKYVKIGDPVVYKAHFEHLRENYYAGYGFDDKVGCWILMETIKEIIKSRKKLPVNTIFVFSSQEETWSSKLRPLLRKYKPNLIIETDVTFATDYGWEDEELDIIVGKCELGKGIVLYRGVNIHEPTLKLMQNIARKHKVKFQIQASNQEIGYNSLEMAQECEGIRAGILGIPLRNMHTPVETINLKDLDYGVLLLKNFLMSPNLKKILEK